MGAKIPLWTECAWCARWFDAATGGHARRRKHCSRWCYHESRAQYQECPACGRWFRTGMQHLTPGRIYCSHACRVSRVPRGYTWPGVLRGSRHPAWKGDAARPETKRGRYENRSLPPGTICQRCDKPAIDRHHKDGNTGNNDAGNIAFLCRRCHMSEDGRLERMRNNKPPPQHLGDCENCGVKSVRRTRGRCHACYQFWWVNGRDRR